MWILFCLQSLVNVYDFSPLQIISTDFGLRVYWDRLYNVDVYLSFTYAGLTSGLCGNFDGVPENHENNVSVIFVGRVRSTGLLRLWNQSLSMQ